jgi:aspartate carbamoyltransferase regulatory subunit
MKKELSVSAIKDGTVIDHIDAAATFKVADILKVANETSSVLVGMNLPSKLVGKKGVIKVENRMLSPIEVNRIAIVAPDATVNIIRDFRVVEKFRVKLPDVIEGLVRCYNPECISNTERIPGRFTVESRNPIRLHCHYCERSMQGAEIVLK